MFIQKLIEMADVQDKLNVIIANNLDLFIENFEQTPMTQKIYESGIKIQPNHFDTVILCHYDPEEVEFVFYGGDGHVLSNFRGFMERDKFFELLKQVNRYE